MSETALTTTPNPTDMIQAVCLAVRSEHSRRAYAGHLRRYLEWSGGYTDRDKVARYRQHIQDDGAGPETINQALSAIRALAREAYWRGAISELELHGIREVRGAVVRGHRAGRSAWRSRRRPAVA